MTYKSELYRALDRAIPGARNRRYRDTISALFRMFSTNRESLVLGLALPKEEGQAAYYDHWSTFLGVERAPWQRAPWRWRPYT